MLQENSYSIKLSVLRKQSSEAQYVRNISKEETGLKYVTFQKVLQWRAAKHVPLLNSLCQPGSGYVKPQNRIPLQDCMHTFWKEYNVSCVVSVHTQPLIMIVGSFVAYSAQQHNPLQYWHSNENILVLITVLNKYEWKCSVLGL